jgi:hypothetical protein
MLSVKTCLHWFVRIAWLVGCSLGLFGYLCSTEQASLVQIACQNLATRKQKMVMFLGGLAHMRYVSACGSWKEWLRRCCSTRARVRLGLHLFRATTLHYIFTATTFFPIRSHPLIRSWLIQSSLLLVPLLAGEEPFWSQPPHPLAADCGVESTIDLNLSRCSCWFCAGLDLVSC